MVGKQAFGHGTHGVAALQNVAGLYSGRKFPVLIGNGIEVNTALEKDTALLCQLRQRILQAVIDLSQQARAKLHA